MGRASIQTQLGKKNVIDENIPGPDNLIQIHGHRNPIALPVAAGIGSFNLEGRIDRGGPLRALALSPTSAGASRGYEVRAICIPNQDIAARALSGKESRPG